MRICAILLFNWKKMKRSGNVEDVEDDAKIRISSLRIAVMLWWNRSIPALSC